MKQKEFSLGKNIGYVIRVIWKFDKILYLFLCIEILLGAVIPFMGVYLPKMVIDLIEKSKGSSEIIRTLGGFCLLMAVVYGIHAYVMAAKYWKYNTLNMRYLYDLFKKTLTCDYRTIESDSGQTRYQKALNSVSSGDSSGFSRMIPALVNLMIGIVGLVLYSAVLTKLHIIIPILLIAGSMINYVFLRYVKNYISKNKVHWSFLDKQLQYLETTATDFSFGKDIRLFQLKNWILGKRDNVHKERIDWDRKIENRQLLTTIVDATIIVLRDGLAYAYLITQIYQHKISIAEFILFFGIISEFSNWITALVKEFNNLTMIHVQITDMRDFMENTNTEDANKTGDIQKLKEIKEIRFEDVSFSYGEYKVLNHFNMTIYKGEKIALVGLNGAGKTTLVKLLCGFYRPEEGRILINGEDTAQYASTDLFTLFATVFQDTYILPFSISENIGLQPKEEIDTNRVMACIEKAGLKEVVQNLEHGIDTNMLKVLDEHGVQLSGGQTQKLLLARALYKDAPILILDEPTAAFDPIAEHELYLSYYDLTKDKTSIFITHRLASTQFCDKILLIENGTIIEEGSHSGLLHKGGRYQEIFDMQKKNYMDEVSVKSDTKMSEDAV
ncbi:ABC transporter ATP-binding protein [Anaerosporobacter sp.]|uniref:ABC transporter ATP-binding protein n=1 Tax=Anaerosporobacter sp. TaxID=1872529 RepID=UPI00286F672F|nr:ABC transporter ATP-binding protein [Anaerosporobacter sp.]